MPDHFSHLNVDKILLGQQYPDVHKSLDSMQSLLQSNHREWFHDYSSILKIYEITEDIKAAWSAFYHIVLDNISDSVGKASCIAELLYLIQQHEIPSYSEDILPPYLEEFFGSLEDYCYD